ncbi:Uncharacterized protein FWK35_00022366 [Aphis craccivora]|uniref:Uncharacterized protein n=1 Tax=Aphis craccivora TaxID=307492 RepID=A0A6G0XXP3_APHCR|nr:Uncharacterized protein FWK35_00022366 [Aphis craccivora]
MVPYYILKPLIEENQNINTKTLETLYVNDTQIIQQSNTSENNITVYENINSLVKLPVYDDFDADPNYEQFGENLQKLNTCKDKIEPRVHFTCYSLLIQNYSESSSDAEAQFTENNENQIDNFRKKLFKNGKRLHMNKRKKLGMDYKNRNGKKIPQKIFIKLNAPCCKNMSSITGISPKSGRGLHQPHNYNAESREIILNHIKIFPAHESHYSRKHTSLLYLSPSLNIQKTKIFSETGLKFKMPYIDTCKTCDEFKIKSKYVTGNDLDILTKKNQEHQYMVEYAYNSKKLDKLRLDTMPTLKAIAGRGSNQIASVLYKFIEENIPNTITHLITYSDTCSDQNHNMNVALMFMLATQKHPSLQIIDQKFLVPGHTQLECDSDHAKIERYKKQSDSIIAIPIDWYNFVRSVRGKAPLKVVEMEQEYFKSFSSFLSGPLVKRNVDVNKEKINWLMIKWLRYDKQFGIVQFKYSLDEDTPFRSLDLRKVTIKTRFRAEWSI